MKKALLFAFAFLFATATMAQTRSMILEESFDELTMPENWSIMDMGASNWSITATNQAGGLPNELQLFFYPSFNGTSRFVSPIVDLTDSSSVVVSFKYNFNHYQGTHVIGIATTSDGGTTWNEGWSQSFNSTGSGTVIQEINTPDMGQANVQFCIFYTGNVNGINYWKFDDISIFTLENLDLCVQEITLPDIFPTGEVEIGMRVINYGITEVTSLQASYEIEGMEPVMEEFVVDIPSLGGETVTFTTPVMLTPNNYNVTLRINLVNDVEDDILDNNEMSKLVSVAGATAQRIPMIEHFSSSTCDPCVNVNMQMLDFCNNNPGRFTYTKYQMNAPGLGDPYYTEECGTRRLYYNVMGIPQCFLDGEDQGNAAIQQAVFDQHAERAAFMDIRGSFIVDGNTITIVADIMPYITTNARVFVSVNEKETHGNVGTNGETEFHHIFMKMLPDVEGDSIDFTFGELTRLEYTQDMSETFVEEMDDLEVSIWVQNYTTKEIFNSRYAYEYTDVHPYPVENLRLIQLDNVYCYCFEAFWDTPAQGNPIGYNVYVNDELVAENITETNYSFEGSNDFYVIGVEALYENDRTSVKALAGVSEYTHDEGLITNVFGEVILDENQPETDLVVTNGNSASHRPIEIMAITENNETGDQYLVIEPSMTLPYTINVGEDFSFHISPNAPADRSMAETLVKVESDNSGTLVFFVTIDGELLKVTELSSTAKIYPNPANDQVRIESANGIESVMVYNMMGVLVETIPANSMMLDVNLSQYSEGTYFFNIRQSDGTVSNQRVVVRH